MVAIRVRSSESIATTRSRTTPYIEPFYPTATMPTAPAPTAG
jgi:hypothetical protein